MEKGKNIKYLIIVNIILIVTCIVSSCLIINKINNKPKQCECPKCDIKEETSVVEKNNEQTSEIEKSLAVLSGKYISDDGDENTYISFNSDGTWKGSFNYCEGYADFKGKYVVDNNMVIMEFDILPDNRGLSVPDSITLKIADESDGKPDLLEMETGLGCSFSGSKYSLYNVE